jgi:hypothetical protein
MEISDAIVHIHKGRADGETANNRVASQSQNDINGTELDPLINPDIA